MATVKFLVISFLLVSCLSAGLFPNRAGAKTLDDVLAEPSQYIDEVTSRSRDAIDKSVTTITDTKEKVTSFYQTLKDLVEKLSQIMEKLQTFINLFSK